MARTIATSADLYGPGAGFTFNEAASLSTPATFPGTAGGTGSNIQTGTAAVPITTVFAGLKGSVMDSPIMWLFGLVLFLIAWKLIEEHRGGRENFHEVKVGAGNVAKITVMVIIGFAVAKYFAIRYDVPGVSSFVRYATGAA